MAGGFQEKMAQFMQGRYGNDQLNQRLSMIVVVVLIVSIVLSLVANLAASSAISAFSSLLNFVGLVGLIYIFFRMFSRNTSARAQENSRFLERQSGKKSSGATSRASKAAKKARDKDYKYLKCAFCGQEMRVPRGKGKIAVKCPKCDEKTIVNS